MLVAVLSCFALAGLAPWLTRFLRGAMGWLVALLPLGLFAYFLSLLPGVAGGEAVTESLAWVPALGLNLSFYLDGLSLLFALLITGIGTLIMVYAGGYLGGHPHLGRFYLFILAFMGSMLGLVLTANLLTLFVFWELTSITSYLLIGFKHEDETSRKSALQALLVTGIGGLVLLAGLILMGMAAGTFELSELLAGGGLQEHPMYLGILLLVLVGAFTKSAQFPFHFWLPGAMAAPTPVSAYLHSATMVKAGIYLLARMFPVLGDTAAWIAIVTPVGAVTMLYGGYLAITKTDFKQLLAYSTVSALGTLVLLLGSSLEGAATAAVVFLLAHALYKGAFFMVAGAVDHETGTREIDELGGLRRKMPITAAVAVLAAVSLAGFGPVLSFIGKELVLETVLESEWARLVLTPAVVLGGALFVAVAAIVTLRPFFGPLRATPKAAHEAPFSLLLGPALLASLGFVLGLVPVFVTGTLVTPAAAAVLGEPVPVSLYLWHGLNPALALSVTSVLIGLGLYLVWDHLRRFTSSLERVLSWGPERVYLASLDGLNRIAKTQTRILQSGVLRYYFLTILTATVTLVGGTLILRGGFKPLLDVSDVQFFEWILAGLILAGAVMAVLTHSRLAAITALGVVGFGVALVFIFFAAPDIAMTQLFVETLTVILVALILVPLREFNFAWRPLSRLRDAAVALACGMLVTSLLLSVIRLPFDFTLSAYFAENSVPVAQGRNIVNVILVDYRALDTLGEIGVLVIAGVGVYALLKLRARPAGGVRR
ncbi:MAG: putative monovalent cation/H+ antiporter subunit A [Deinococcota bacterium]|nr:putative monovalent cation/H+ antiporter subunit A [Deinococcota bacterium]